jgi:hypothetical protein
LPEPPDHARIAFGGGPAYVVLCFSFRVPLSAGESQNALEAAEEFHD